MTDTGQRNVLNVGGNIWAKGKTRQRQDWEKYQRSNKVRRASKNERQKVKVRDKKEDEDKQPKIPKGKNRVFSQKIPKTQPHKHHSLNREDQREHK